MPQIREFIENGGTVDRDRHSAMNLAQQLKLPVENQLVENGAPLPASKFYVPGSVLTGKVDPTDPLATGMSERTDLFFDNSPVFKLGSGRGSGPRPRVRVVRSPAPLRSGWAWGQKYLEGGVARRRGAGRQRPCRALWPGDPQRAQPHGTFKLLFNALFASASGK